MSAVTVAAVLASFEVMTTVAAVTEGSGKLRPMLVTWQGQGKAGATMGTYLNRRQLASRCQQIQADLRWKAVKASSLRLVVRAATEGAAAAFVAAAVVVVAELGVGIVARLAEHV